MFFLDHIWLIPLLPGLRRGDHVLLRPQAAEADRQRSVCRSRAAHLRDGLWRILCNIRSYAKANRKARFEKRHLHMAGHRYRPPTSPPKRSPRDLSQRKSAFLLDPLSGIWLLFVTGVGTLIHIYSTGYMAHEGGYYRFFGYLNLFMFSMLTLILANNYALMFVGWEGVGFARTC